MKDSCLNINLQVSHYPDHELAFAPISKNSYNNIKDKKKGKETRKTPTDYRS